ncbi:hypothetical protein E2C01_014009 [Portunus trituberculatus]|uniref:Uncharacterized protein n=1 Tax=Portunus trituberculatus TaxID=210409 RepID=A0A5B7DIX6_PORTR|nr:hypothetical protein [Portunus trituberculatus]
MKLNARSQCRASTVGCTGLTGEPAWSRAIVGTRQLKTMSSFALGYFPPYLSLAKSPDAWGAARVSTLEIWGGGSRPTRGEGRREEEWGSWSAGMGWSGPARGEQSGPHAAARVMDVERAARDVVHVSCMLPPPACDVKNGCWLHVKDADTVEQYDTSLMITAAKTRIGGLR